MPLRAPPAVGVKRTGAVQLWPAVRTAPFVQLPPAMTPKSSGLTLASAITNWESVRLPGPLLVRVTVTGKLADPTVAEPKSMPAGAVEAAGASDETVHVWEAVDGS